MPPPTFIRRHSGRSELLSLLPSFVDLSAGTEFGFYKEPQWRFLLSGEEISAFVLPEEAGKSGDTSNAQACEKRGAESDAAKFSGCVLRVKLDKSTAGFGMVLVDPSHRGMGLARRLVQTAMADGGSEIKGSDRSVLAVCSKLGQKVYRKMGFKDAGMVYALSCSVSDMRDALRFMEDTNPISTGWINGGGGEVCSREGREVLIDLDRNATGYDRSERINLLLDGYAPGSTSTVAFGYDFRNPREHFDDPPVSAAAVSRQDCPGSPLIVGPMIGPPEAALPLIWTLSRQHQVRGNDVQMSILISDHPEVVERLLEVEGVTKSWEGPAMSMDGDPIYCGDGSYLALMHPTLG